MMSYFSLKAAPFMKFLWRYKRENPNSRYSAVRFILWFRKVFNLTSEIGLNLYWRSNVWWVIFLLKQPLFMKFLWRCKRVNPNSRYSAVRFILGFRKVFNLTSEIGLNLYWWSNGWWVIFLLKLPLLWCFFRDVSV